MLRCLESQREPQDTSGTSRCSPVDTWRQVQLVCGGHVISSVTRITRMEPCWPVVSSVWKKTAGDQHEGQLGSAPADPSLREHPLSEHVLLLLGLRDFQQQEGHQSTTVQDKEASSPRVPVLVPNLLLHLSICEGLQQGAPLVRIPRVANGNLHRGQRVLTEDRWTRRLQVSKPGDNSMRAMQG